MNPTTHQDLAALRLRDGQAIRPEDFLGRPYAGAWESDVVGAVWNSGHEVSAKLWYRPGTLIPARIGAGAYGDFTVVDFGGGKVPR